MVLDKQHVLEVDPAKESGCGHGCFTHETRGLLF